MTMEKNDLKKSIIDFFKGDETWHRLDATITLGVFDDNDWQEIATACGKDLYLDGGQVYTEEGLKMFKKFKAI